MRFKTKLLLQLMNLESRKEKKGTPMKEHFIVIATLKFRTSQVVVALRAIKPQLLVALDTF